MLGIGQKEASMGKIEVTWLSQADIIAMGIGTAEVIDLIEKGLAEHGRGRVENPPKPGIHATRNSFIHAMPAYYKDLNIGGMKWVSGYSDNRDRGFPQIIGILILNDMDTGAPLCVMDATWITAVRTAAVSAITAKYCAKKDACVLGIVGAGTQGRYNLLALDQVVASLEKVKVFDIKPEAAERYRVDMVPKTTAEVIVCKDVESVARGSDILITATQRLPEPLIRNEWFDKGCLGMGLEASRAWHGSAILNADKFVTDDWDQCKYFHAQGAFPEGLPTRYTELGTIVTGQNKGRENDEERILAINIGLALEDIILADRIYRQAKEREPYPKMTLFEWQ